MLPSLALLDCIVLTQRRRSIEHILALAASIPLPLSLAINGAAMRPSPAE
jgi:hypothetical protein